MKALKPSMKENKRYLSITGKDIKKNVEEAILGGIGVLGMSKTGLNWISSSIIAINREMVDQVRASFAIWPEKVIIGNVSGTLKGLKKK